MAIANSIAVKLKVNIMNNKLTLFRSPVLRDELITSFDSVFDKFFQESFPAFSEEFGAHAFADSSYPKVDIIDTADDIVIQAAVPGLEKQDVNVEVTPDDKILTISGSKKVREEKEGTTYIRRELKRSAFTRSFALGSNMDASNIDAKFTNGILTITIAKKVITPPKVKRIELK